MNAGQEQTLLQTLVLPIRTLPTLLPTLLLEPRYFLIPYVLLRAQVVDMQGSALAVEGVWYVAVNTVTMYVFLYCEREGVSRFMWWCYSFPCGTFIRPAIGHRSAVPTKTLRSMSLRHTIQASESNILPLFVFTAPTLRAATAFPLA